MPSITSSVIAAGVLGGTSLLGAGIGASAAQSAASDQSSGEEYAANVQQQMYNQTVARLQPYNAVGEAAAGKLQSMTPFNFQPTMAQLAQTPGYQFTLGQGLNATQNSLASQGLGRSGQGLAGAANYAEGLAGTTYQNQFQNALSTYSTNLGAQQFQANLGENAAATTGQLGTQVGSNIGQTAVGAANAQAAGLVGTANAISGGLSGAGNAYLMSQFFGKGGMYGGLPGYGGMGGMGAAGAYNLPAYGGPAA